MQLRVVEASSPGRRRDKHRTGEIGFRQNRSFGEAAGENGAGKVCAFCPHVVEPGFLEISTCEGSALEARAREDGAAQLRASEVGT